MFLCGYTKVYSKARLPTQNAICPLSCFPERQNIINCPDKVNTGTTPPQATKTRLQLWSICHYSNDYLNQGYLISFVLRAD